MKKEEELYKTFFKICADKEINIEEMMSMLFSNEELLEPQNMFPIAVIVSIYGIILEILKDANVIHNNRKV